MSCKLLSILYINTHYMSRTTCLPRHEVAVAGNVLMSGTVHGISTVSVCLQISNSFNSGMDEATLFKFGKLIDYGKSHPKGKKISPEMGVVWVTFL